MKTCTKCGWYAHDRFSVEVCNPEAGERARVLIQMVPEVPSTQLGWGYGNTAFSVGWDNFVIVSNRFHQDGHAYVKDVRLSGCYSTEAVADLVRILVAWQKRHA